MLPQWTNCLSLKYLSAQTQGIWTRHEKNDVLREIPLELLLRLIFVHLMQRDKDKLSESLIKGHK